MAPKGDQPARQGSHVYQCKWSGVRAFELDVSLDDLPMRRSDNARVVDTHKHKMSLERLQEGDTVYIQRRPDKHGHSAVECQHRLVLGELPVAYRSARGSKLLYVMDDAVEECRAGAAEGGGATPVPPCIVLLERGAGVLVDVDDRGDEAGIVKVRSDVVLMQMTSSVANEKCNDELLHFLAKALAVRRSLLTITSGRFKKQKVVQFADMSREAVYNKLRDAVDKGFTVTPVYKPVAGARNT